MKLSIKRTNYWDLYFPFGYSLKLVENKYGLKQACFFDILVNFELFDFSLKLLCQIGG